MPKASLLADAQREAVLLLTLFRGDRVLRAMLGIFLAVVLAMILIYVAAGPWAGTSSIGHALRHNFDLGLDDMLPEQFNHGLAFLAVMLFLMCFIELRSRVMIFLAALYGFIWFDDSVSFHERAGGKIGAVLNLPKTLGLGPQELGELLAWAMGGVFVALVFLWFWRRRRAGDLGVVVPFLLCFVWLVFFGMVVDMLHALLPPQFSEAAGVIEDGGEMLVIAVSAALALGLARHGTAYYRRIAAGSD
ncbi:hypothetical protein [Pseudodonghicola flavimaris]|uniref:Cell division protein FtsK n=1 Tax=Pseudodonghicola flavimaris TaxID=3050036 RepID=A0ABT7F5B7_9RHOB|nr:hypothetical protein [Pseudodonghicola flavimaris]MDK3019700.1 hypothetical protein [Pseudodonghicola flavimaris]